MKTKLIPLLIKRSALLLLGLSTFNFQLSTFAQGTAFTYQGRLNDGALPASGNYDLTFSLFGVSSGGSSVAGPLTNSATAVSNGLFTVPLDFGANFPGANRWLQIGVRTNGSGAFSTLLPRQQLTATPYAITASNLTGALPAAQLSGAIPSGNLSGAYSSALTLNNAGNSLTGNGAGLTALNASQLSSGTVPDAQLAANIARTNQVWLLGGNAGTSPGANFLGTTDNQPLELHVNGARAMRLEPNANTLGTSNLVNVVGGSPNNSVAFGVLGATIAGGGALLYNGSALTNSVNFDLGTVGGGGGNTLLGLAGTVGGGFKNQVSGSYSTVVGGLQNTNSGDFSVVAGGSGNRITNGVAYSTIGGGVQNMITASGDDQTIAGGSFNQASAAGATIGGGVGNKSMSDDSTIAGGTANQTEALGAAVGGGQQNVSAGTNAAIAGGKANLTTGVAASVGGGQGNWAGGNYSAIPGGSNNTAVGIFSFAAGQSAQAMNAGAFVWADSQNATFQSSGNDQFLIRAQGGVGINTNNPNGAALNVAGVVQATTFQGNGAALTSLNAAQLTGTVSVARLPAVVVTNTESGVALTGAFSGNGAGLTNVPAATLGGLGSSNFWKLGGNAGANPANGNFIGTTDTQPLEFRVSGARALRIEPNTNGAPNLIAGAQNNFVSNGVVGATIAGGGATNYFGDSFSNAVTADFGTVSGGAGSTVSGITATVGGGSENLASADYAVVAGGVNNHAGGNAATIGGGSGNSASGGKAMIGGGLLNSASGDHATVSGGYQNTASALDATVSGGEFNTANFVSATVSGGDNNTAHGGNATVSGGEFNTASGNFATVCGGFSNTASGFFSFAGGFQAQALDSGSFVWNDQSGGSFASTAPNQFSVHASGGVLLAADVSLAGGAAYHNLSLSGGNASGYLYGSYLALGDGIHLGYNYYYDANGTGHVSHPGGPTSRITAGYGEVDLAVGGANVAPTNILRATTSGVTVYGTFNNSSDRNAKQDFARVSSLQILDDVLRLPVSEWSYKADPNTRHIGPTAQDFYSTFNIGTDDKHIAPVDEGGLAFAAIQGLNEKLEGGSQKSEVRIQKLEAENAELKARLDGLEQLINSKNGGRK